MNDKADEALVAEARAGDRESFSELVRRYEGKVRGLTLRMTGDASDADDLAQEVFLTAFRSLDGFEGRSGFYTWLYRIAVNLSLNFVKKRAREKGRAEFSEDLEGETWSRRSGTDPARESEMSEFRGRLDRALESLPAVYRASFLLVAGEGLSHAEAAGVMGCSETTISWRMHKTRLMLRKRLNEGAKAV